MMKTWPILWRWRLLLLALLVVGVGGSAVAAPSVQLIGGTALAKSAFDRLEKRWVDQGIEVTRLAGPPKGLAGPGAERWTQSLSERGATPDLTVVWLGEGDAKDIASPGGPIRWSDAAWRDAYLSRVYAVGQALGGGAVLWLGPMSTKHPNNQLRHGLLSLWLQQALQPFSTVRYVDLFAYTSGAYGEYISGVASQPSAAMRKHGGGWTPAGADWVGRLVMDAGAAYLNRSTATSSTTDGSP